MKITAELIEKLDSLSDDHLFPRPSILEKLCLDNIRAADVIVSRAEQIQKSINEYEKSLAFSQLSAKDPLAAKVLQAAEAEKKPVGLNILASIFKFLAADKRELKDEIKEQISAFSKLSSEQRKKHSFAITGDNMRQAIKEYMDEREIDPQRIRLTKDEIDSLRYLIPLGFSRERAVKGVYYKPRHDPIPLRPA
jgi:hypothetical protein